MFDENRGDDLPARILIVEDDGIIAARLQDILTRLGYVVLGAVATGEEALQQVEQETPDLLLMDIYLAGALNGIETAAQIQSRHGVPVVYLTAYSDDVLLQQAKITGPYGYLIKPIQDRELQANIEMALYRHKAEAALGWESDVNAVVAELSQALISPASLDDISLLVLDRAKQLTGSLFGYVGYIEPQTGNLVAPTLTRDIWDTCEIEQKNVVFKKYTGLWGWVLDQRQSLLTNTPQEDPRSSGTPSGHIPILRFLAAPAMIGDVLVGQVALANPERDYTRRDLVLVERLASLYALAVQRNRSEQAMRRYAEEQSALYALASAVAGLLEPAELLSTVLDVVLPLLDSSAGWVVLPGPALEDIPQVIAWQGLPGSFLAEELSFPLNCCPICTSLMAPDALMPEPQMIERCPCISEAVLEEANLRRHVGIPLIGGKRILGILNIAWSEARPYTDSEKALLTTIGQQIGMALRNAQLYQAARQVDRLQVLNDLDHMLSATLDPERVAQVTLQQVSAALRASMGMLILCGGQADFCSEQVLTITQGSIEPAPNVELLRNFLPGLRGRYEPVPLSAQDLLKYGLGLESPWTMAEGMAMPIHTERGMAAVLLLAGRPIERPFSDEDQALVQAAAGRAGQALQNAYLYDELRALLRERERAQAQLIHSEKMAALGRLVASIAHEINNPLQAMQGCLTLASEEVTGQQRPEKLERYMGVVEEEVERVATIVRRMRDFYRPARKEPQPTDLHVILEGVLELADKQLQHSDVSVSREWAADLPLVQVNPDHFKQVFLNLVLNAIDAMPNGGVLSVRTRPCQIEVKGRPQLQPAVGIEFADTGVGMTEKTLSHVFEPFFTTKEQGSGLGLSISYGIVEAHNGQIYVESQLGEGTTFTILLPVGRE